MIRVPKQMTDAQHQLEGRRNSGAQPGEVAGRFEAYRRVTAAIQAHIGDAIRAGETVRARGRGWAFSSVGLTPGTPVEAGSTGLRVYALSQADVIPGQDRESRRLCFVEGGLRIGEVQDELAAMGLALKTTGSNAGQTLAGAISTGTHGSALRFGAMQDFVTGLHLVVGPDRHVYLERATAPEVRQDFADRLGAELVRDDTLFEAALVGLGAFGVIQGVTIEPRALFLLHAYRREQPCDDALRHALGSLEFSQLEMPDDRSRDALHHFGAIFNTAHDTPPPTVWADMLFEAPVPRDYAPPDEEQSAFGPNLGALETMAEVLNGVRARVTPTSQPMVKEVVEKHLQDGYQAAIPRDLFRGGRDVGRLLAVDMGVPLERALDALDVAFRTYYGFGRFVPVLFACRYVRRTRALLGFTRFDPTCVLEVYTAATITGRRFVRTLWANLNSAGVPFTLHWGKWTGYLSPRRVREMYGEACEQWVSARATLFESDAARRAFANPFLQHAALV